MSFDSVRLNLSSAEFPFLLKSYGRSVIVAGQDTNYVRPNKFSGEQADANIGIPQLIFCENVLPFAQGYQSVGFTTPILPKGGVDFDEAFYLRDSAEARTLFVPAGGACYLYDDSTNAWVSDPKIVPSGAVPSVANLKGRTFVCFAKAAEFYEWNSGTFVLDVVVFTALTVANIEGLCASTGYLLAWTFDTIFWSNTLDPTDFVPNVATGAGSEKILSNKGRIIYVRPIDDGFIVYTTQNTIYAFYSGNIQFPWVFKELKGSAGLRTHEHSCEASAENKIFVYSTAGLMKFNRVRADQTLPVLSEFLSSRKIESYNSTTKTVDTTDLSTEANIKIAFIGERWLVISYGASSSLLTHALVYDTGLDRWGKIRIDHIDCFEFFGDAGSASTNIPWAGLIGSWANQTGAWDDYGAVSSGLSETEHPYQTIGFLGKDGKVSVVDFRRTTTNDVGVLYIGRIQYVRSRNTILLAVEAEGVNENTEMEVLTSLHGSSLADRTLQDGSPGFLKTIEEEDMSRWQMKSSGKNHTLRFRGNFELSSVQVDIRKGAYR
jgi:hypothetical protein